MENLEDEDVDFSDVVVHAGKWKYTPTQAVLAFTYTDADVSPDGSKLVSDDDGDILRVDSEGKVFWKDNHVGDVVYDEIVQQEP